MMKKISTYLISGILSCASLGLTTSCSDEDYPGPDPVEVTANYSNKFSNPNPNLSLTYSDDVIIGKSVDFSTVKGETANITLYDIIPGESALKLINVPIIGDETGYSFSGNGTGNVTEATFNYNGRVEKGKLTISLTDIKMAKSSQWAQAYITSPMTYGRGKDIGYNSETDQYEWIESDDRIITAPLYTDMDVENWNNEDVDNIFLYANITGGVRGIGSYFIAQLLSGITLEADGNISAKYTSDELYIGDKKASEASTEDITNFMVSKLFGKTTQEDIDKVTTGIGRKYISSPRGLVYWYVKNEQFYVKLNLPAIITKVMQDKGKTVDENVIATLTDLILSSNPVQLKQLLTTINKELNNSLIAILVTIDDNDFQTIFSWIKDGIPMRIEKVDGNTRIFVEKEMLTPIINLLPSLAPSFENIPMGTMLYNLYLTPLVEAWYQITKLNVGIGLTIEQ